MVIGGETKPARLMRCFLTGVLGTVTAVCGLLGLAVMTWGRIDVRLAGVRLGMDHPNDALLLGLLLASALAFIRNGLTPGEQLQRLEDGATRYQRVLPLLLVVAAFVYLVRVKLLQHYTFHTGAYDLAMYDSAIRNTLSGRFMFADQLGRNFFSEHFSPILLFLVPLYGLADTPVTALLVEALCVAGGVACVYGLARHYRLPHLVAVMAGLLFLNYRFLARGVMFDFHPEMMEPTFLLAAITFMLKRRWVGYTVSLVLALACKEDVPIYTFCLGVYAVIRHRETRCAGWVTCAVSLVWAILAWRVIIPAAMPENAEVSHFVAARWGHLGEGYLDVAMALLKRPFYVAGRVLSSAPREMLWGLGLIPLFGVEVLLLAVPGLVLNTTTTFTMQSQLQVHYAAPIVPFVFWAFILGMARVVDITQRLPLSGRRVRQLRTAGLAMLAVLMAATFGADYEFHALTRRVMTRYRVMAQVAPGSTVSCETGFVPHLSREAQPFLFPEEPNRGRHYRDCAYILVDRQGNPWPLDRTELNRRVDGLLRETNVFETVMAEDGVILVRNLLPVRSRP